MCLFSQKIKKVKIIERKLPPDVSYIVEKRCGMMQFLREELKSVV